MTGQYICNFLIFSIYLVTLVLGQSDNQIIPIRIRQHPISQIAPKGSKVIFKCEYEVSSSNTSFEIIASSTQLNDNTNIKLSWLFNSKLIVTSESDNTDQSFIIDRNRLLIQAYDPVMHSGQYRCLINNTLFMPSVTMLSEPANLSLAFIDTFESSSSSSKNDEQAQLNMSEGNVAIITCKLPQSNPPAIPIFYFNDVLLHPSQSSQLHDTSNRYKVFPSGNLQISNVKNSDSGLYRCSARNPITNEIKINPKRTTLKVYEPFGTKLPEIVYSPVDTNRVQLGANLTLECVANGAPVPLVSWEKFGGILPEKRSFQIFGNLILTNIQPEDKGTYVCRAENGPGQATFKTAMIDIFEAPSFIDAESNQIQVLKKSEFSVDLKCPVKMSSRPRADIQWYYQGKLIFSNNQPLLTIKNLQATGVYQCFAQNEYGFLQANFFLTSSLIESKHSLPIITSQMLQQDPPLAPKRPIIIMGPQNTTIYEGQSVVLLCITGEGGSTQINWLQNDLIIEPTLMRRFEINQLLGNLRIVSIQKSDAGIYKCIASNEYGMSTAEAFVQVKSTKMNDENESSNKPIKFEENTNKKLNLIITPASASRPIVQQIGVDKILLKWNLNNVDSKDDLISKTNNIAYFKVDYKTNKQQQQIPGIQPHMWLTIDEQIDPKKREYILTDLNKFETYRFRITTFYLNGELVHSHQSARFKLESPWPASAPSVSSSTSKQETSSSSSTTLKANEFKLSQIRMQITQVWAISSSSLGLKWKILTSSNNAKIAEKINGFYIYYRKVSESANDQLQQIDSSVPLYNYTRINLPISIIETSHTSQQVIDTYIIANLEASSQYEIKMTCYNLQGDLCSFSNNIFGLTTSQQPTHKQHHKLPVIEQQAQPSQKSFKYNEIIFMVLGVILGILTLLLLIFIVMCIARHRQHKRLLAQLHNTSQKLTSSSCPTLIYEDSLRNHQNNRNLLTAAYNTKLLDNNLFLSSSSSSTNNNNQNGSNDSNSTNSQSMSTTTSSMTTPPALVSAQTNADLSNQIQSHILLLNGNTVTLQPPPIPQVPPPPMLPNQNLISPNSNGPVGGIASSTLNRMNINLNPLNGYLENASRGNALLSPVKTSTINAQQQFLNKPSLQQPENFYHTLTQLGNLPNNGNIEMNDSQYADYNNTTLNMRAHYLIKQQQQQQQILINTLKTINLKQQQLAQLQMQTSQMSQAPTTNSIDKKARRNNSDLSSKSPSTSSMRRNNSVNSSKRSRKSSSKNSHSTNSNESQQNNNLLQLQQQQQQKNYYLLPNMMPQHQATLLNRNVYNDVDLLTLEAALNQNNLALLNTNLNGGNVFLINNQASYQQVPGMTTFMSNNNDMIDSNNLLGQANEMANGSNMPLMFMNIFENTNNSTDKPNNINTNQENNASNMNCIYESSDMENLNGLNEQEPMLTNHYASTGLMQNSNAK